MHVEQSVNRFEQIFLSLPLVSPSLETQRQNGQFSNFPSLKKLPQLPRCFSLLQKLLASSNCWKEETDQKITALQLSLSPLVEIVLLQKEYANRFWHANNRKIQLSILHLFICIKDLCYKLIPSSCQNIRSAVKSNLIAIKINKLKQFVTEMYSLIKNITLFMRRKQFKEEQSLIQLFIKEIIQIFHDLPQISRQKWIVSPPLLQYLMVLKQIEHFSSSKSDSFIQISNRSCRNNTQLLQCSTDQRLKNNFQIKMYQICADDQINDISFGETSYIEQNQFVYQHSKHRKQIIQKKETLFFTLPRTRTHKLIKKQTITTGVTASRNASITHPSSVQLRETKSKTEATIKSPLKRVRSFLSSKQREYKINIYDNLQLQKEKKPQIKKVQDKSIFITNATSRSFISLNTGKSKGWGILRAQIQESVVRKMIAQIIYE